MDRDPHKPNFIFSSDIHSKAKLLAGRYRIWEEQEAAATLDCDGDDPVSLVGDGSGAVVFHVNAELNTFLLRNRENIRPSDLAKDNLISIAKTAGRRRNVLSNPIDLDSLTSAASCLSLTPSFKAPFSGGVSPPYTHNTLEEIFILTLTLKLLEFEVKRDHTVAMEFVKDECYGIMMLCDYGLVDQLEAYIQWKFANELKSNAQDRSGGNDAADETLDYTFDVNMSDISIDADEKEDEIDTSSTMNSDTNGKSFLYEEDELVNSSMEELNILRSNDITRSNTQDDEDEEVASSRLQVIREESSDKFLKEISNLRHNDLPVKGSGDILSGVLLEGSSANHILKIVYGDDIILKSTYGDHLTLKGSYVGDGVADGDEADAVTLNLDNLSDVECDIGTDEESESPTKFKDPQKSKYGQSYMLQPAFQFRRASPSSYNDHYKLSAPQPPSLPLPPPSKRNSNFVSPRRGREKEKVVLKKTLAGSFSMIKDEDEASGLEYAFRDRSPTVPSYIKQDKKFKFIKVGKVQKFVNLFEEKKPEESGTGGVPTPELLRQLLYNSVRVGSPARKE